MVGRKGKGWFGESKRHSQAAKKGSSKPRGKMATAASITRSQKGKTILGSSGKSYKKGGKHYSRSTEAAEYLSNRARGMSKTKSRSLAIKKAEAISKRLLGGRRK